MFESLLILFWICLGKINFIENKKLNDNFVKIIHSVSSSVLAYNSITNNSSKELFCNFSKTYFIYDTFNIIIDDGLNFPYILHHLISIYILQDVMLSDKIYTNIIINGFVFIEISNLSIYVTYYLIKNNYNNPMIKLSQILWYGYFRIYLLTYLFYEYNDLFDYCFLYFSLVAIYLMSISWWFFQNYSFYKENKIYENIMDIKKEFNFNIEI